MSEVRMCDSCKEIRNSGDTVRIEVRLLSAPAKMWEDESLCRGEYDLCIGCFRHFNEVLDELDLGGN